MDPFAFLGFCGILASLYAIYVERSAHAQNQRGKKKYVALCDIGDNMSCSRVLTSEYASLARRAGVPKGSLFDVPNTYFGLLFYIAIFLYPLYPFTLIPYRETLLLFASLGSIGASCLLAYILFFVLHDVCLICMTTYVINLGILCFALQEVCVTSFSGGFLNMF